jgi:putative oxidoreductase
MMREPVSDSRIDAGLLALRLGAGVSLILFFGLGKLVGYCQLIISGAPLGSSGLTPLIRQMGFPAPAMLGLYAVLCESILPLLVAAGFLTRLAAAGVALSMTAAFYVSMRLEEEPLRALLYIVVFTALVLTGPGRFSIDHWRQSRKPGANAAEKDAALSK